MTKREHGKFKRNPRDYYPTPEAAMRPLYPHLPQEPYFVCDPCAGDGRIGKYLMEHTEAFMAFESDIMPQREGMLARDAFEVQGPYQCVITNPPWHRPFLHPFIRHCVEIADFTWLLFDADWIHTRQSIALVPYLTDIVSVGRVKWIEDSKNTGFDNASWYRFSKDKKTPYVRLHGREL